MLHFFQLEIGSLSIFWRHLMNTKNLTWNVTSLNGADPFDVVASNLEDAVCDALVALGWTI